MQQRLQHSYWLAYMRVHSLAATRSQSTGKTLQTMPTVNARPRVNAFGSEDRLCWCIRQENSPEPIVFAECALAQVMCCTAPGMTVADILSFIKAHDHGMPRHYMLDTSLHASRGWCGSQGHIQSRTSCNGLDLVVLPVPRHILCQGVVRIGRTQQRLDAAGTHLLSAGCSAATVGQLMHSAYCRLAGHATGGQQARSQADL